MNKLKMLSLSIAILILVVIVTAGISAEKTSEKSSITTRQLESQTVLYTIYRGHYEKIGQAIGKLYAIANSKGIQPGGQLSCVYLNNPEYVPMEHCLTEIRIPVANAEEALKHAGTLGEMTDIKVLPTMEVAVIIKPGTNMDYADFYKVLYNGIAKIGYRASDNACETFSTNTTSIDYSQMKSEIIIPIKKISYED
jgi:effector-binding domain-containing protein